jgi:hypothetical protein
MTPEQQIEPGRYVSKMALEDLDMYSILLEFQSNGIGPRPVIAAAQRATAHGEGGEHTHAVAAIPDRNGRDTVEALDTHMEGLLEEWGGERLDNIDAAKRALLTLCRRIIDGEMAPATGAAVIGGLRALPPSARLPWETIRPFFAAAEQLHPDHEPSEALVIKVEREIVDEATRALSD